MSVSQITRLIYSVLEQKGCRGRIVSIQHLADLKEEIEARYNQGALDEVFYRERLTHFEFKIPESFPGANSIIIPSTPAASGLLHIICPLSLRK